MAAPRQGRVDTGSKPGAGSGSAWTKEVYGLPTWAWVLIGGASVAGVYVFVRGLRKPKASTGATSDTTYAITGQTPATTPDSGPIASEPVTPLPPVQAPPTQLPTPLTPVPPLPVPAGTIGRVFTAQDVRDMFAQVGLRGDTAIQRATVTPTTESAADRIDRIVRQLNNGDRSRADVFASIQQLPGAATRRAA